MSSLLAAYEQVFYPSSPRTPSSPDRLAAVGALFGISPPDPESARVLEIGCSDGGNLLPLAVATPKVEFLGIDFARPAIERGQERIRELALTNVELRVLDLTEFPEDAGAFDYIIAHGIVSWVPPEVRTHVLRIIQRHLAPNGVAYVDYNAQPGGHLRYAFREAMLYHTKRFHDPKQRIDQARSLIRLIIEANPEKSLYRAVAETELQRLLRTTDAGLFHDDLSEPNDPLYFHEFIAGAASHELQYLGEADVFEMNDAHLPAQIRERISVLRSIVEKEQYLDILKGRHFRQTLLCRAGCDINRVLDGTTLKSLWLSSAATSSAGQSGEDASFQTEHGAVRTMNPLAKAVLEILASAFPARRSTLELVDEMRRQQPGLAANSDEAVLAILVHAVMSGVVEIHARRAPFTTTVMEKPLASPLARLQIARGESVSTLNHRTIEIADESERRILPLLDGTRSLSEIAGALGLEESDVRDKLRSLASLSLLLEK